VKLTINVFDPKSIDAAIKAVEDYKKSLETKVKRLAERLAEIGRAEAEVGFQQAIYDGTNDVVVSVSPIENGYAVNADGKAVCFIEFGTGKFYQDTNRNYRGRIPDGVVDIGEYGSHHGMHPPWNFIDESGNVVLTYGNPANLPMFYASQEMRAFIIDTAKEVFAE